VFFFLWNQRFIYFIILYFTELINVHLILYLFTFRCGPSSISSLLFDLFIVILFIKLLLLRDDRVIGLVLDDVVKLGKTVRLWWFIYYVFLVFFFDAFLLFSIILWYDRLVVGIVLHVDELGQTVLLTFLLKRIILIGNSWVSHLVLLELVELR